VRSFLNTEISFGLITIPVKVYSAAKDLTAQFNQIHTKCCNRIHMMRYCPSCDEIDVPFSDISKGYEVSKGKYAIFSADELKELDPDNSTVGIEILEFVDAPVEPHRLEKSYWLGPNMKGIPKSYVLLCKLLKETKRTAICRIKLRSKTRLAVIRESNGKLLMSAMKFDNELVSGDDVVVQDTNILPESKEWKLALMLVESMATEKLVAEKYVDTFKNAVIEKAQSKVAVGGVDAAAPAEGPSGGLMDLAALLEQSLKADVKKAG
jgi:DNA end-binding protein Ku